MAHGTCCMIGSRALALILIVFITFPSALGAEDISDAESPPVPVMRTISVTVRDGATTLWSDTVSIPDSDTATTTLTASDGTSADALAASAIAALIEAETIAEFTISNLQYFSSFGSFYVKCITAADEKCDSWQYVVNDSYPSMGMDQYLLHDGDVLFVYFGSPRRTRLSTSTIHVGEHVTATAERYVPSNDTYTPESSVTIGVTQTNPDDPYTPLVIATSTSGASGTATFALHATGTYAVGIAEDYYYPSETLTVLDAPETVVPVEPTSTETLPAGSENQSQGGGSGERHTPQHRQFDSLAALSFLESHQSADGSFATPLLSDWAAIAYAASPALESGESMLKQHLIEKSGRFTHVTDYERRAMALMALGINPYSGTATNYIEKILSFFDGEQFGDAAFVNDDIFALLVLEKAGYGGDALMRSTAFVISKQRSDGSWDGSLDLTAAAIQSLLPLRTLPHVDDSLARATEYLRSKQEAGGGFGNSFSTSWALLAMHALGATWENGGNNPEAHLATLQAPDGGVDLGSDARSRIWATSYAVPAALEKPWHTIMHGFSMPTIAIETDASAVSGETKNIEAIATSSSEVPTPLLEETATVPAPSVELELGRPPQQTLGSDPEPPSAPTYTATPAEESLRQSAAVAVVVQETPWLYRTFRWLTQLFTSLFDLL